MKKFLFAAFFATLALGFSSCTTGGNIDESDAIGSWDVTSYYWIYKEDGVVVDEDEEAADPDYRINITIEANGTYTSRHYNEGELLDTMTGTWSLSGDKLTINEDGDIMIHTIEKLNGKTMVLSFTDKYTEDGVEYDDYERMTLTKVN